MKNNLLLCLACFLVGSTLFAQVPQFAFPPACEPGLFGSEPFFVGEVTIDGVDAVPGVDSIAVFDENDNVIISSVIQTLMQGGTTYTGFGFKLRPEDATPCNGYSATENITLVFYDASNPGCKFKTSLTGNFLVTLDQPMGTTLDFVEGPDGDVDALDVFDFDGASCVTALPVDFASFQAVIQGEAVKLSWATGKEVNNSHFEIEASANGERWESIGIQAGAGNSDEEITYEFLDLTPNEGQNLYRVKQVDFDGAYSYSSIATVTFKGDDSGSSVKVFPNPITNGTTSLSLTGNWTAETTASLYDFGGRKVAVFNGLQTGSTTLELPSMAAGVYQLVVTDQAKKEVIRVVIR